MGPMTEREAFAALQAENVRLVALLESHGIAWRMTPAAASQPALTASVPEPAPGPTGPSLSTAEKVALFRRLLRGRTDVYPVRWEGKTSGKSGYAPACANEWRAGVCEKPRIKCGDCGHRLLVPLSDSVIYDHLAGKQTIGVYPLLEDDSCYFLAVDFDEADWQQDAQARNAQAIAKSAQEFYQRVCKFVEHFGHIQTGLDRANRAYNDAVGSFDRMVRPSGERLKELGGGASGKEVPQLQQVDSNLRLPLGDGFDD